MTPEIERTMQAIQLFLQPNNLSLWFCVVLPLASVILTLIKEVFERVIKSVEEEESEKLKNEDLIYEDEKPKRGRLMLGDDGELLEIVEEENEE